MRFFPETLNVPIDDPFVLPSDLTFVAKCSFKTSEKRRETFQFCRPPPSFRTLIDDMSDDMAIWLSESNCTIYISILVYLIILT